MCSAVPQFLRDVGITKVEIKALNPVHGALTNKRRRLVINKRGGSITRLVTLWHEYLHALHPEWTEDFIRTEERKILIMLDIHEELEKFEGSNNHG